MRLTKQTSHAIRILVECARRGDELVKVQDIAEAIGLSRHNGLKIVNLLSHAGFIEAARGRTGGVRLARAATAIRIGEVVRAIELSATARADEGDVEVGQVPLGGLFDEALDAFIGILDQHTIADMAKSPKPRETTRSKSKRRTGRECSGPVPHRRRRMPSAARPGQI